MQLDKVTNLDGGIVGQATYLKTEDSGIVLRTPTGFELSVAEFELGIGPCWRPGPGILYGGALIHWIDGSIDTDRIGDYDISEESIFGIYIGGGVELPKHLMVTAEVQATPDALGWGIGAQWRF
jgi:hypothetical protein